MKLLPASVPLLLFLCFAATSYPQAGSPAKSPVPKDSKDFVPLKDVVSLLETILDAVQDHLKADGSPPLQSAEFDFQTVTTNDTTGGLIVSIVTLEGEHVKAVTRETDFIYTLPSKSQNAVTPKFLGLGWLTKLFQDLRQTAKPEDFNKTLPAAIIAAADTMKAVREIDAPGGNLTQRSFVITLSFSVTNSFNAGVDPSSLIMVAPELKYVRTSQNVQTLKLTFADQ